MSIVQLTTREGFARHRRLRRTGALRRLVAETRLSAEDFVYPLFVTHGSRVREEIEAMPGQYRISLDQIAREADDLQALRIPAVLLFGLLFIAAWAILGLLALQPLALSLIGVGIALMIGFMIHPKYRERVGKVGSLWLGISLSKPLLLLLMGAVFSYVASRPAFAGEGVNDGMVNATSVFLAAAAMLVLAFALPMLYKYVPILPSSSTSMGEGRQSVAGAAMIAGAGAAIASAIRQKRRAHVQSGTTGGRPNGGPVSTNDPSPMSTPSEGQAGSGRGSTGSGISGRRSASSRIPDEQATPAGQGGQGQPETRTIGELQKADRAGTGGAKTAQALKTGAGAVGRGSVKVAAGGATAFLLAGREAARQASMRGQRTARSMAPDTDHISGR